MQCCVCLCLLVFESKSASDELPLSDSRHQLDASEVHEESENPTFRHRRLGAAAQIRGVSRASA
eukprot:1096620-Rhodomonas_salina.1